MKLLRAIAFDASDARVFETAARPGEWAVPGTFAFFDVPPDQFTGKTKQAFANGFLGIETGGRSTFVSVVSATPADAAAATDLLARYLQDCFDAPSPEAAEAAARDEIEQAADLAAELAVNTVLAVLRSRQDDGTFREAYKTIRAPDGGPQHARIWTVEHE